MMRFLSSFGAWLAMAFAFMCGEMRRLAVDCTGAVTVTTVLDGTNLKVVDVEATADADTTAVIPHNFGVAVLQPLITLFSAAAALAGWHVSGNTAANVTLTKNTAVGSGAAGVSVRVFLTPVHSINK